MEDFSLLPGWTNKIQERPTSRIQKRAFSSHNADYKLAAAAC